MAFHLHIQYQLTRGCDGWLTNVLRTNTKWQFSVYMNAFRLISLTLFSKRYKHQHKDEERPTSSETITRIDGLKNSWQIRVSKRIKGDACHQMSSMLGDLGSTCRSYALDKPNAKKLTYFLFMNFSLICVFFGSFLDL